MTEIAKRRPSLTIQLLVGTLVPMLLVITLSALIAFFSAQDEISEVYDSQLITSAQQLWAISRSNDDVEDMTFGVKDKHLSPEDQDALADYAKWRSFRVWRKGELVMTSDKGPALLRPKTIAGFSEIVDGRDAWRIFTFIVPEDGITVEVAEKLKARRVISGRIVVGVTVPLLLSLPVILLVLWLGIRWGLRDLRHFATAIKSRSPSDLSRVGSTATPAEIAPVADSVDQLLTKLERSLAKERLFTDNAAHELRTPLAALSLQAEVIRNARTAREREPMLDELSKGVARTSRLLDQLLTLARVGHTPIERRSLNIYQVARDGIRDIYPKAQAKGIELSLVGEETAFATSNASLLALLISNILDNAVKYAPANSAVDMALTSDGDKLIIAIRDHGPGIPENERENVFARFYRLKGRSQTGSGLGLSIVQTLCELLATQVILVTPAEGNGLLVKIILSKDAGFSLPSD